MCNFISWIQYKGEILFLTDSEVFSSFGRKRLEGCLGNDFLGHGAIRKFFKLKDNQGEEREESEFWDPEAQKQIPKVIVEKLTTPELFKENWGRIFRNYFQNDDLVNIIKYAPEPYKEKAWKQLFKQKPGKGDLYYIIKYGPRFYKEKVAEQFLKQKKVHNYDLRIIIRYVPEPYKEEAKIKIKT